MDVSEPAQDDAPPPKKLRLGKAASMASPSLQDDLEDVYGEEASATPGGESSAVEPATREACGHSPPSLESEDKPFCLPGLGGAPSPEKPPADASESSGICREAPAVVADSQSIHSDLHANSALATNANGHRSVENADRLAGTPPQAVEALPSASGTGSGFLTAIAQTEHLNQFAEVEEAHNRPTKSVDPTTASGTLQGDASPTTTHLGRQATMSEDAVARKSEKNGSELRNLDLLAPGAQPITSNFTEETTKDLKATFSESAGTSGLSSEARDAVHGNGVVEAPEATAVGSQGLDLEAILEKISVARQDPTTVNGQVVPPQGPEGAEFEPDSSPYTSSEDSSDSSSEAESDDADDYQLLDPAETARRLLEDDGGSDGEGPKKWNSGPLKTANEIVDESIEIPNVEVTAEMEVCELGSVESKVDNLILVKGQTPGEYRVLDSGSLLCLESRQVIGLVAETLGRVQQPLYCVRFPSTQKMVAFGLEIGTVVYYVPKHSFFVFTKSLEGVKGSDASNLHDEEVRDDEIEFSDDEAEAAHKRAKKLARLNKKGIVPDQRNGTSRRGHFGSREYGHGAEFSPPGANQPAPLNYDEIDEPYTRLARPADLHKMQDPASVEFLEERVEESHRNLRGHRGRGRGRGGHPRRGQWSGQQLHSPGRVFQPDRPRPHFHGLPNPQSFEAQAIPDSPYASSYTGSSMTQYHPSHSNQQSLQPPAYSQHSMPSPGTGDYPPQPALPAHQQYFQALAGQYGQAGNSSYPSVQQAQAPAASPAYQQLLGTPGGPAFPAGAFVNPAFFQQQQNQREQQQQGQFSNQQQHSGSERRW